MPCDSSHLRASRHEEESLRLIGFLREVGLLTGSYDQCYGRTGELDKDTATLCAWCKANDVTKQSLELQIWWRDHQKADALKAARGW